jgi:methylated-DNA-[protein]-cysteine S-methyltransferase
MDYFREKVYKEVSKIPEGKVSTYKRIARLAGRPKAWRAVGNILNKNRSKKVPCHRIVRSDGRTGGYEGGNKKKIALLEKEGIIIDSNGKIASGFGK